MRRGLLSATVGLVCLVSIGCAKRPPSLDRVQMGMTEDEVVGKLGRPRSVSMQGNTKYLEYASWDIDAWGTHINHQFFYVRVLGGKVDSFGRKGDFDSSKNPTKDININQKIETTDKAGKAAQAQDRFDLQVELSKLEKMKKDGLLNEAEYQQLRQRAIDKAKAQ